MDDRRFDDALRALAAHPAPRRAALRLLAGGALGAVLARLGLEEAASQTATCKPAGRKAPKRTACCSLRWRRKSRKCLGCPAGTELCPGTKGCFDLDSDERHCGVCGTSCGVSEVCDGGRASRAARSVRRAAASTR